jgi:hypothetical protein
VVLFHAKGRRKQSFSASSLPVVCEADGEVEVFAATTSMISAYSLM